MAVIDQSVADEAAAPPVVHKSSAWRWILAGVVALVVAAGIGFSVWAAHYQPIVFAGAWSPVVAGGLEGPLSQPGSAMTNFDYYSSYFKTDRIVLNPAPGKTYGIQTSLRVDGPYSVQVLDVTDDPNPPTSPTFNHSYEISADTGERFGSYLTGPFHPAKTFELTKFGRGVKLNLTVPKCATHRTNVPWDPTVDHVYVKYKFLWFVHYAAIDLATSSDSGPAVFINMASCPFDAATR